MVNAEATSDRRTRQRAPAAHAAGLGATKLNPFGDLHTLQHLSARLARALRGVFEPLLRREVRVWAEPLVVQRFGDYRTERADGLTAWLPLVMSPQGATGLCVLDGVFVLERLDLFFGGTGAAPATIPLEFSPAAEAIVGQIGAALIPVLAGAAWFGHGANGFVFSNAGGGWEYPAFWAIVMGALALLGDGAWALRRR